MTVYIIQVSKEVLIVNYPQIIVCKYTIAIQPVCSLPCIGEDSINRYLSTKQHTIVKASPILEPRSKFIK